MMIVVKHTNTGEVEVEPLNPMEMDRYPDEMIDAIQEAITFEEVDEHVPYELSSMKTMMVFSDTYWKSLSKSDRADIFSEKG